MSFVYMGEEGIVARRVEGTIYSRKGQGGERELDL